MKSRIDKIEDKMNGMSEKLIHNNEILIKIDTILNGDFGIVKQMNQNEKRIKKLEVFKIRLLTVISIFSFFATFIVNKLFKLLK
jgi:hypothetical protein